MLVKSPRNADEVPLCAHLRGKNVHILYGDYHFHFLDGLEVVIPGLLLVVLLAVALSGV